METMSRVFTAQVFYASIKWCLRTLIGAERETGLLRLGHGENIRAEIFLFINVLLV